MTGRTYSILRSSRTATKTIEVVVATGMTWEAADSHRNKLAEEYRTANPLKSSWSGDVFIIQMEAK